MKSYPGKGSEKGLKKESCHFPQFWSGTEVQSKSKNA